jgi:hypothetical protein
LSFSEPLACTTADTPVDSFSWLTATGDVRVGRAGGEAELLGAEVAGDLDAWSASAPMPEPAKDTVPELGAVGDLHRDADAAVVGDLGGVDLRDVDLRPRHAAGREVELPVQQLDPAELRRVGDAVDAVEDRVDLELVGLDLLRAERAAVGGLVRQALDLQQQRADLAQRALGGVETLLARLLLSIAWLMPAISLRSVSLAIRRRGVLAALIFSPLLSRSMRVDRSVLFLPRR